MATLAETAGGGGGAGLTGRNGDSMVVDGVSGVKRIVAVELPLSGVDARLVSILITGGILSCRLRNPFLPSVAASSSLLQETASICDEMAKLRFCTFFND